MIYLDTNVLLYATLTKVDNEYQKELAIKTVKTAIINNSLVLSNLTILEYTFVMKKAQEDDSKIKDALSFFKTFVKEEKAQFSNKLIEFLNNDYSFKNSFDLYHIVFANSYNCETIATFDKGFKKFKDKSNINIKILKSF